MTLIRDTTKLVWDWVDNINETSRSLHCYYPRKRKDEIGMIIGEYHYGNSALCNKKLGVSEDGESFLSIDKIESHKLNEKVACKSCLKIGNKLKSNEVLPK